MDDGLRIDGEHDGKAIAQHHRRKRNDLRLPAPGFDATFKEGKPSPMDAYFSSDLPAVLNEIANIRLVDLLPNAENPTPIVRLQRIPGFEHAQVYAKLEWYNPFGAVKDRVAANLIADAENRGVELENLVEPTSGNTGIGLAMVAAVKGYKLLLVMPESMSVERRRVMRAYGASFDLTPREQGMKGAIERAKALVAQIPNSWMPQQFDNPANLEVHRRTTAREIAADFPEGLDYLITGVGTGGHISGVSQVLKETTMPGLTTFAVEPVKSAVLSGGGPGPHRIQGIGAGFVPGVLDRGTLDGVLQVTEEDAFAWALRAAREEGILVGPSSGASLAAVAQVLASAPPGRRVLTFCYDTGERYLSVEGLFPLDR